MIDLEKPFLGISHSVLGQVWRDRLDARARNLSLAMAQTEELPEVVARVLTGRGVMPGAARDFMAPSLRDLMPDPDVLTDMKPAAARLELAVRQRQRVAIFGDYDVDGAASSAILSRFLAHHGIDHEIWIPDRIFEGYGPNVQAISELAERGARLLVTVDCGSTSFEALAAAKAAGLDTLVLDHHQMDVEQPPALALVNPNRHDDLSGLGYLCAAGVVLLTLVATARLLRSNPPQGKAPPDLLRWLDLVALATVADVAPLKGLNRAFVVKGLLAMGAGNNPGLVALGRAARLDGPPRAYHLGFVLGPRINAGGRIGDAALGARLLTLDDPAQCTEIAERLEMLNRERQAMEKTMLEEALAEAEREIGDGDGPAVIVTASDQWHPGIVGLLASRLKERFRRPAFAVAFDSLGRGTGSGRSIAGVDLGQAVREAVHKGVIAKGGGHAMAAGVTVDRKALGDFRAFMEEALAASTGKARQADALLIDGAFTARSATLELYDQLERAGPYGAGHPSPVFVLPGHHVRNVRLVGGSHLSMQLAASDGAKINAIAFRSADTELGRLLSTAAQPLHVAGTLSADLWQGSRRIQFRITDAARPEQFR